MFASGVARPGGMVAMIGMPDESVEPMVAEAGKAGTIAVANYNSPGQVVLSGEIAAVDVAAALGPRFGSKRAIRLNVSGAFHSPLMASAREDLARAIGEVRLAAPRVPLVSNVTGKSVRDPGLIRDLLELQLTSPVMWRQSVEHMVGQGIDGLVEIGPGNVLCGLARRIAPEVKCAASSDPKAIEEFLAEVRTR
jgi:[acyl-carrier-protein] S-malonyltransferase